MNNSEEDISKEINTYINNSDSIINIFPTITNKYTSENKTYLNEIKVSHNLIKNLDYKSKREILIYAFKDNINMILQKIEIGLAKGLFNTINFAGRTISLCKTSKFDNKESQPFEVLLDSMLMVLANTDKKANTFIMSYQVWNKLKTNCNLIEQLKNILGLDLNKDLILTTDILKEVLKYLGFNIKNILIKYETTAPNQYIWDNCILVGYIDKFPKPFSESNLNKINIYNTDSFIDLHFKLNKTLGMIIKSNPICNINYDKSGDLICSIKLNFNFILNAEYGYLISNVIN